MEALADGRQRLQLRRIAATGAALALAGGVALVTREINFGLATLPFSYLVVMLCGPVHRLVERQSEGRRAARTLAEVLGGTFKTKRPRQHTQPEPLYDSLGWLKTETDVITGSFAGYPMERFTYSFLHPLRQSLSRQAVQVTKLHVGKPLPHVAIRARDGFSQGLLDDHIPQDERIRIEGDFEKYFNVFTHRRTASDALAVLDPHVLIRIMDYGQGFDTEFIGEDVYIYSPAQADPDRWEDELRYASVLAAALKHKLKTFRLVLPGESYPALTTQQGVGGTMQIGDKLLSWGWVYLAGYIAWSCFRLWLDRGHDEPWLYTAKLWTVVVCSIAIAAFLVIMRRKRRS